jgi:cytosine deaminase
VAITSYCLRHARIAPEGDLADLVLDGGAITAVAPAGGGVAPPGAAELDLAGRVVLPGFVDAHTHIDKCLIADRVVNRSGTLDEAVAAMMEAKRGFTHEDVQRRARRAIAMAVAAGTTAIRSHVDVDEASGFTGFEALLALRRELADVVTLQLAPMTRSDLVESAVARDRLRRCLELGADVIGGVPRPDGRGEEHIALLFRFAKEYDRDLDLHIDEKDEPTDLMLVPLARHTIREGYQGRVTAGHCCALASAPPAAAREIIALVRDAGIHVISLPAVNLHLMGRHDDRAVRRGVTRVRELLAAGVNVAYGSDNVRDSFTPFGSMDLLQAGLVLGLAGHLGDPEGLRSIVEMATVRPARIMFPGRGTGVAPGRAADLVVLDDTNFGEAILNQPPRWLVFKGGRLVARTTRTTEVYFDDAPG